CVKYKNHDICNYLITKGADKSIKNNQGYSVVTENIESDQQLENVSDVSITASPVEVMEILNQINNIFARSKLSTKDMLQSSEPSTIKFDDLTEKQHNESANHLDTDNMIKKL